ncbi:glutamate receptor 2-like [Argiope bruennichi]|uniref:Glutamate receptor ionotropic like protein n=1 Tax=Argiope bruennichi TaxID=94029 RepID=A0A8T0FXP3_ARGBR|nr:glutamate receptor 2-like [Argiope bruennichi]KAF8795847.1 Glutamate receptor ionotropic like protein [Argiope bruennichi]
MKLPSILKVAIVPMKHILEINQNAKGELEISGMEGWFLNILSSNLGFKYDIVKTNEYGTSFENGTWTGIMGMLQKDEADFALSVSITEGRACVVQFSETYGKEDVTFAVSKQETTIDDFWFIHPLDPITWCLIFVSLIATSVILSLINKSSSIQMFSILLGTLLKQPFTNLKPSTLLISWLLVATILAFSYSAVLLSHLTLPPKEKEIRTFEELAEAVQLGDHRCYAVQGSVIVNLMRTSKQKHVRLLMDIIDKNKWFVNQHEFLSWKKMAKNTAVIYHRSGLEMLTRMWGSGGYKISSDVFVSMAYAIAAKKKFCCIDKFNKVLSRIVASDIRKILKTKSLLAVSEASETSNENSSQRPIKFENIKGLIIGSLISYLMAFILLIAEVIYFKRNQN